MLGDISFANYEKADDIHGTVLYPAVMIAPVQKKLIQEIMSVDKIRSVFDPFYGSGTSLYEAFKVDNNLKLIGCDINPLAYLITSTKLNGVSRYIKHSIKQLEYNLTIKPTNTIKFYNIDKWFRKDIQVSLMQVREAIIKTRIKKDRMFFWCMFCDTIRKYSNTRSSTYKLHIKTDDSIQRINNNVISDFKQSVNNSYSMYNNCAKNIELYKTDTMKLLDKFEANSIDMVITSPPYGDNATTVTYGQYSSIILKWIDEKDLRLEGWELTNYSVIDSNSLGGTKKHSNISSKYMILIKPYIDNISSSKKKKVINFFSDYFYILERLCKITKKYIVFTVGNRTVDGVEINLNRITQNFFELCNFKKEICAERNIVRKRTPKHLIANGRKISSMNKEYVIVYSK